MYESMGFMRIPDSIRQEYKTFDPESDLFFEEFDEKAGSKILEIGSQHSPVASMLSKSGFNVTGVDLRDSDQEVNYTHITSDFCQLPISFYRENIGTFDVAVSISAIEHFGLNTYGEGKERCFYDVTAMRYIYDFLKPGGVCYLTVPFGGKFVEVKPHWRVYDWGSFNDRLAQSFFVEKFHLGVCEKIDINGVTMNSGQRISIEAAMLNTYGYPNISCFAKLRKVN
jgi:SAM-dependent methyltransferase